MAPLTRTQATFAAPIVESRKWVAGVTFPADRPLINVSQAAPVEPPPQALRAAMADFVLTRPEAHLYGPVLGNAPLRDALAAQISAHYGGAVTGAQVGITAGCNQAFAATMAALTGEGDEVILPTPWYFNHKMWLDMGGVRSVPLPTGADMLPDPEQAAALITPRTRAIVLVSPNNPAGVEYPASLMRAFYDLAARHNLRLVVDETYRDFHSVSGAPHDLFTDPDWDRVLVHLYSFSKTYRLTGHRVGAVVGSRDLMLNIEKFLDTVAICPGQPGQFAALWGIENLSQWVAGERAEILDRRAAITQGFAPLAAQGWQLKSAGAYFAYVAHPFAMPSDQLAQRLVHDASILLLPATMFVPPDDPTGPRDLRIAFANIDRSGITTLFERLQQLPF